MVAVRQGRINYIDALRGFTMTLVVFAHVLTFSFGMEECFLSQLFITFRMPMFFFISGYIAYKAVDYWTAQNTWAMLKKKMVVQVIPATFFLIGFIVFRGGHIIEFISTKGVDGYWFTYTLLAMFIVFYGVSLVCNKVAKEGKDGHLFDILIIAAAFVGLVLDRTWRIPLFNIIPAVKFFYYFQFFTFGLLCRRHHTSFMRMAGGDWVPASVLVVFVMSLYLLFQPQIHEHVHKWIDFGLSREVVRYAGLIVVFVFFFKHREFFDRDNVVTRAMLFIGRRTLDIYLIHFFLIPDLTFLKPYFEDGSMFTIHLFLALAVSLMIIALCLLVSEIIRTSDFLGHYLLGAKRSAQK